MRSGRWSLTAAALAAAAVALAPAGAAARAAPAARGPAGIAPSVSGSDADCVGRYGAKPARRGPRLRFGVDPELAGTGGAAQLPAVAEDPAKKLARLFALRPRGKQLVLRVNRMFWSDGESGVRRFEGIVDGYTRRGFDVELQVRYHPAPADVGNIAGWVAYVRHAVDVFGVNPRVVAMTITNEVNLAFSPNTSDGYYQGARDALIAGMIAARDEANRRRFAQLRFGFTFAYRFVPSDDASFFAYLAAHGGHRFAAALDWVGLDFYPGQLYPPVLAPTDSYRAETAQALGVLRDCFLPLAQIGPRVPLWITENGVPTTREPGSEARQLAAMRELVGAVSDYSATYNVTDYRWFNLRDNNSSLPSTAAGFSTDGLLRDDYTPKLAFAGYRDAIARLGAGDCARGRRRRERLALRHRRVGVRHGCRVAPRARKALR